MNRATIHEPRVHGEVSERSKEHAWKVCIPNGIEGSNPSLSASPHLHNIRFVSESRPSPAQCASP